MSSGSRDGWDLAAVIAAAIPLVMIGFYLGLVRQQGGPIAVWFVVGLAAAALLSTYGAARSAPRRRLALAVAGVVMVALGFLGLLTIGLPILVAGVIALVRSIAGRGPVPHPHP